MVGNPAAEVRKRKGNIPLEFACPRPGKGKRMSKIAVRKSWYGSRRAYEGRSLFMANDTPLYSI